MTGPALRNLYLARSGFSALWVFLVLSLASAGNVGLLSGFLLTLYPVSDAAATVFDLRRAGAWWPQRVNLGADLVASVTILVALRSGLTAAITAFGAWAMLSGILMIVLAVHRQRFLGGQWLLILSGAGSVLAGVTFLGWTGTAAAGLAALAQYSAGGAVWYLLTGIWLSLRRRVTGQGVG